MINIKKVAVCSGSLLISLCLWHSAITQVHQSSPGALSFGRMKTASVGVMLYVNDNDDYFPFSNRGSIDGPGWGFGRPDYVWYELVYPYTQSYDPTESPFDPFKLGSRHLDPLSGEPLLPDHPNYWYAAVERSNLGLNYDFLAPWVRMPVGPRTYVGSKPTNINMVAQPNKTIELTNTLWSLDSNGVPQGGGNWIAEAPCVRSAGGSSNFLEPVKSLRNLGHWYSYGGWKPNSNSWLQFGASWPWYEGQKFQYVLIDGSVRATSLSELTNGCDVQANYAGFAPDGDAYLWDIR